MEVRVNQIPSSLLQLHGVFRGEETLAGFFNFITGPMTKVINRRKKATRLKVVDQRVSRTMLKKNASPSENIPTIMCCFGVFLMSIVLP